MHPLPYILLEFTHGEEGEAGGQNACVGKIDNVNLPALVDHEIFVLHVREARDHGVASKALNRAAVLGLLQAL